MANQGMHRPGGLKWLAGCLVAAVALGLATPAVADVGQYGKDRVNDFVDIFRLRAGLPLSGRGYGVKARATSLAQVGFVHYNGTYVGLDRRGIGAVRERRTEGGVSIFYASANQMMPLWGNEYLEGNTPWTDLKDRKIIRNLPAWDDGRSRLFSVGAEVALPFLALDLGLYPEEALDFATGFFLVDIYRDDELFLREKEVQRRWVPTDPPTPDLEASTRRKQEELDALYGEGLRQQMLEEGQLSDEALEGFSEAAKQRLRRRYESGEITAPPVPARTEPAMWNLDDLVEESPAEPLPVMEEAPAPEAPAPETEPAQVPEGETGTQ